MRGPGGGCIRAYGRGVVGMGLAAFAYHASWGAARPLLRKLDYYAIAAGMHLLRRVHVKVPPLLSALSVISVPAHPLLVTVANAAIVEGASVWRAARQPRLLAKAQLVHAGVAGVGAALFTKGDHLPFAHAAWHLAAAGALATLSP